MKKSEPILWTALITPLNERLEVDYPSLELLLKEQETAKNGVLILGSTGEALNMTLSMKKEIIEFVCRFDLKVPIMAGVGGHQLNETREWVQWLETQAVQSYLMVTPIYAKPGAEGQYRWFKDLMDLASRPVVLYNVPGRSGIELAIETVQRLSSHKNFAGIKEASGSVEKFKNYYSVAAGAPVYCGDDALMNEFAAEGSYGLISVASNVWPSATHKYVQQCLSRNLKAVELWKKASNLLFIAANPVPAKRALYKAGRIKLDVMLPPLHQEDLSDDTALLQAYNQINQWEKEQ